MQFELLWMTNYSNLLHIPSRVVDPGRYHKVVTLIIICKLGAYYKFID